jgi:hypothetical protein
MKKIKIFSVLVMLGMVFLINGCKKDDNKKDGQNCDQLSTAISNALTVYMASPTTENCTAFYDAVQNFYDGCSAVTDAQRAQWDALIASSDCSGNQ